MPDFKSLQKIERLVSTDQLVLAQFEREGERQAQKDLPSTNSTSLSKFENDEIKAHQDAINHLMTEVERFKSSANVELVDLKRKVSSEFPNSTKDIEDRFNSEIDKIEAEVGPRSAVFDDNATSLAEVTGDLKLVKRSLNNRELQTNFESFYIIFMIALAFAEVWVNRLAFELFFESNPLVSLFLAVAVGGMLVFFAHITGISIKRALPETERGNRLRVTLSMLLLNGLVGVFVFYLAKMRQAFVSINSQQGLDLEGLLGDQQVEGLDGLIGDIGAVDSLISTSLGEEGLFLLLVNVIVYVAGTVAAIIRHDSHPDYEKLLKLSDKYRAKQVSLKKRYEARLSEVQKSKSDKLSDITNKVALSENRIETLEAELKQSEAVYRSSGAALSKALKVKINAFRDKNVETRSTKPPKYFRDKVSLEV